MNIFYIYLRISCINMRQVELYFPSFDILNISLRKEYND